MALLPDTSSAKRTITRNTLPIHRIPENSNPALPNYSVKRLRKPMDIISLSTNSGESKVFTVGWTQFSKRLNKLTKLKLHGAEGEPQHESILDPLNQLLFVLANLQIILAKSFQFITVRKRSLGQGNVFTPVCQSFCSHGCIHPPGQTPPWQTLPRQTLP